MGCVSVSVDDVPNCVRRLTIGRILEPHENDRLELDRQEMGEVVLMSPAKTNSERQREFRQRKAETQATEVRGIFAHPDDHAEVKEAAAKIARRRQRAAQRAAP